MLESQRRAIPTPVLSLPLQKTLLLPFSHMLLSSQTFQKLIQNNSAHYYLFVVVVVHREFRKHWQWLFGISNCAGMLCKSISAPASVLFFVACGRSPNSYDSVYALLFDSNPYKGVIKTCNTSTFVQTSESTETSKSTRTTTVHVLYCTLTERKHRRYSRTNQKSMKSLPKDFTAPRYLRATAKYKTAAASFHTMKRKKKKRHDFCGIFVNCP